MWETKTLDVGEEDFIHQPRPHLLPSLYTSGIFTEYSGAVKPPVRMSGNRESGHKETDMFAA